MFLCTDIYLYRYDDLATASDLRYYAMPDLQTRLDALKAKKVVEDAGREADSVTPDQIAEIVGGGQIFLLLAW